MTASPNNTVYVQPGADVLLPPIEQPLQVFGPIIDSQGNQWTINAAGQVVENGVADLGTGGVEALAYSGGLIWQEATPTWASGPLWWAKTYGSGSYDGWSSGPGTHNANGTMTAPIPIDPVWLGGGNNEASNPADWSSGRVPIAGDLLSMFGGVMNIHGNALQGDTLTLAPYERNSNTLNLSGTVPMSVAGGNPGSGPLTVNLADNSEWVGGFSSNYMDGEMLIQGSGQFSNTASSTSNYGIVIDADVIGSGTFTVASGGESPKLEFMKGVSSGQTIQALGGGRYSTPSLVQIDDPKDFHASIQLGYGEITLEKLTATSYDIKGDILSLFNGNKVVDTLRLSALTTGIGQQSFGVSQVGGSVVVHADGSAYQGTLLPLHT